MLVLPLSFLASRSVSVPFQFKKFLICRQEIVLITTQLVPVISGIPQGSLLGALLFLVYAIDMPRYIQYGSSIALFTDDSKLFRPTDCKFCRLTVAGPGLFTLLSTDHGIKFNTAKCKVLHMTRQEEILSTTPTQLVALWPQLGACY